MFFFLLQCRRIPPPAPTDGAPKNTASRVTDHTASVIHHVQGRSIIHRSSIGSRPAARPRVQGSRRDAARRDVSPLAAARPGPCSRQAGALGSVRAVGGGGVVLPVSSCFRCPPASQVDGSIGEGRNATPARKEMAKPHPPFLWGLWCVRAVS